MTVYFLGSTSSCLPYMCPIIMVIQSYKMYRDKIHKKLELCIGSKFNATKRARLATFARSIVENICLLRSKMKHNQLKIRLP